MRRRIIKCIVKAWNHRHRLILLLKLRFTPSFYCQVHFPDKHTKLEHHVQHDESDDAPANLILAFHVAILTEVDEGNQNKNDHKLVDDLDVVMDRTDERSLNTCVYHRYNSHIDEEYCLEAVRPDETSEDYGHRVALKKKHEVEEM